MNVIAYHFWSPTCAPCNIIKPAVEDLKEEFPDVHWVPVNTHDDTYGLASKYKVSVVPTIVVIYSGTSMITYYSILRKAIALSKVTTS